MFSQKLRRLETVRVGELLVKKGLITPAVLEKAIAAQQGSPKKLGEILIEQGHISAARLKQVLLEQKAKRWAATALLALGATAGAAPQIATQTVEYRPISSKQDAIGGAKLSAENSSHRSHNHSHNATRSLKQPAFMNVALSSNPKPTAHDPLMGFCHPTAGKGYLSQGNNGITHRGRMAFAYDLATPIGTPIYAMRSGTVVGVRDKYPDTGGGRSRMSKFNYIWVEHDSGYRSAYIHLQQDFNLALNLKKGDYVQAGQLIGYTGNSGWSTGPHLHIEVQKPKRTLLASSSKFSKTVPFAVSGRCQSPALAKR